jgi:hypothetical protein
MNEVDETTAHDPLALASARDMSAGIEYRRNLNPWFLRTPRIFVFRNIARLTSYQAILRPNGPLCLDRFRSTSGLLLRWFDA